MKIEIKNKVFDLSIGEIEDLSYRLSTILAEEYTKLEVSDLVRIDIIGQNGNDGDHYIE